MNAKLADLKARLAAMRGAGVYVNPDLEFAVEQYEELEATSSALVDTLCRNMGRIERERQMLEARVKELEELVGTNELEVNVKWNLIYLGATKIRG